MDVEGKDFENTGKDEVNSAKNGKVKFLIFSLKDVVTKHVSGMKEVSVKHEVGLRDVSSNVRKKVKNLNKFFMEAFHNAVNQVSFLNKRGLF